MALYVPAGSGKSASRYRALTQPLNVFECVAEIKNGREIHRFKDLKADDGCLQGSSANPMRSVLALFLADFFGAVLKEPMPDEAMFELLHDTSRMVATGLDAHLANLHLATMIRVLHILGIDPDVSTARDGSFLDMAEGVWVKNITEYNRYCLSVDDSRHAALLSRMTARNQHLYRFTRHQRNEVLDRLIKYFTLHGYGRMELASLPVLRELFD